MTTLKMAENNEPNSGTLVIKPDIFLALVSGIVKLGIFFGVLCGLYWLFILVMGGENPVPFLMSFFSIEQSLALSFLGYASFIISLVYLFYITVSLNILRLEFSDDKINYSSGIFFIHWQQIEYSDAIKTNFRQYGLLNLGMVRIEFAGAVPFVEIPYVAGARKKAELIMRKVADFQARSLAEKIYLAGRGSIEKEIIEQITKAVTAEKFSRQGFVVQIANISRKRKIGNDIFEVILSYMLKTNRVGKKDVMDVLFDLMNQQVLSRKDVSEVLFKISGERI